MPQDLSLEDPHFHPADAVSGVRRGFRIVDIAAQRVQRDTALAIPFGARDLGAAETAGAGDANAFGTEAQCRLHGTLHGTAKRDAALELVSDALSDELGVDLRLADLDDVEADVRAGHRLELFLELLDVRALLTDDHARARGIDRDAADLGGTLDDDLRDRGLR